MRVSPVANLEPVLGHNPRKAVRQIQKSVENVSIDVAATLETHAAEEVADEDDQLALVLVFIGVERFEGCLVALFVLDWQLAGLADGPVIRQLVMSSRRLVAIRGTHVS